MWLVAQNRPAGWRNGDVGTIVRKEEKETEMNGKLSNQRWMSSAALLFAVAFIGVSSNSARAQDRSIDGSGNNVVNTGWGATSIQLLRLTPVSYADLVSTPADGARPSARKVSNVVCAQAASVPSPVGVTDFFWQWGQFVDHDISLTGGAVPFEPFNIPVPLGDPSFDPFETGTQVIFFVRSVYDLATGMVVPRQQMNLITAYIDASNVYGSDLVRALALRRNDGTGRLGMSQHRLLPFNIEGLPNAGGPDPSLFLAGDVRANEQVALTAMHTLFVREHNRLANQIWEDDPSLTGEEIYQRARAIVGALMQVITYNEFLPVLLGPGALSGYTVYNAAVDASISNIFSTAAYRFGHSMLSPTLLRLKRNGQPIAEGNLALMDAFFAPQQLDPSVGKGIEPLLRGLASQLAQDMDVFVIDDVRNFLFGPPGSGGFDLAALNIQRGRDHGLASYNVSRIAFGLAPASGFADISSDGVIQARLAAAYGSVDDVDVWVGGLAEDHVPGALVGELFWTVLREQFRALRDGDRFWYQTVFSGEELEELESTTLADIIRRNTSINKEIQENVFILDLESSG